MREKPKKFITIRDIEDSLRAKERQNRKVCSHPIKHKRYIGYGYMMEICSNCGKSLWLFRKKPTQTQRELFQKFEINKKE